MELSGKTKEHFLNWLEIQDLAPYKVMFDSIPEFVQISYIVQWLDSVDLKVCVEPILGGEFRIFVLDSNFHDWVDDRYSDRISAYKEIIKKCDTIYNGQN